MNTHTTLTPASDEATLGWNAMPAYGEVMSELRGLAFIQLPSCGAPPAPSSLHLDSFWSSVRSQFLALAA